MGHMYKKNIRLLEWIFDELGSANPQKERLTKDVRYQE